MSDQTSTDEQQLEDRDASGPTPWSLGGDAPEPQKIVDPKAVDKAVAPAHTHTGTDPLGRAIGPAEDHLDVKRVWRDDGDQIVKPYTATTDAKGKVTRKPIDTRPAVKAATETAEATDTKPEAVDDPTPYTPSEVAAAHERGEILPPKEK